MAEGAVRPPTPPAASFERRVLDAAPALLAFIDADLRYRFVNEAYARWFGHEPSAILGRPLREVLGDQALAVLRPMLEAALAGETVRFEREVPYVHGGTRWVEATYTPSTEGGRVIGLSAQVVDVTERRRAERERIALEERERAALEDAERQRAILRSTFERAPAAVAILEGAELRCVFANAAYEEMTGGRAAVGRTARELFPEADAPGTLALIERVLATGEAVTVDALPVAGDDRRPRYLDARFSAFHGASGAITGVLTFLLDVTAQVRARARSSSLLAIATALSEALTAEAVARVIVERIFDEVAPSAIAVYLLEEQGQARLVAHRGMPEEMAARRAVVSPEVPLPLGATLRTGEPQFLPTREELLQRFPAMTQATMPADALQAAVSLPLRLGPRILGGIAISFASPRTFDAAKREFLLSVAGECAIALERAQLFQQNLKEQERFRAVFDHAGDAMLLTDEAYRFIDVNPAACRLFGRPREELLGRTSNAFMAPEVAAGMPDLRRQFLDTGELRGELRLLRPDGSDVVIEYSSTANVVPGSHLSVMRDVSERRRAAEILRFLADASDALGSSLDPEVAFRALVAVAVPAMADWAVVDMPGPDGSVQMVAVAHADPEKIALAHELRKKYPPATSDPQGVGRVLATGEPEIVLDIPDELLVATIPDPELLRIIRGLGLASAMTLPLRVRDETVGALTFIAAESRRRFTEADVTFATEVARRAAITLDHARAFRDAQEANRLKDEFLGTVSHELRTPLNAILGWVSLLRGKKASDPASLARGLDTIERNARSQARLIEDVLDVSRIISGKLLIQRTLVDGGAVLRAALEVVAPMAAGKGVVVESVLEPEVAFVGDADRLQQVAWNLLSNAVKFTPAGGRVHVVLRRDASTVVLEVSDTGVGIEPSLRPYVFDRFRQADSSPSRRHGGLGLGLAIARHLVELHGGSIAVESAGAGKGSTFTVRIPVRAVQQEEEPTSPSGSGERPPPPSRVDLRGVRVLVCDDDPDARELLQLVLGNAGAEVAVASSVEEAIGAAARFAPAVVVSDIGMPGEDGYQLVRRLRALAPGEGASVPAIALTAYARASDARLALAAGFQVHLAKPIREDELLAAVGRLAGVP